MVRAVHLRVLPMTRGECVGGPRPCPLVSCRYHLLLDVAASMRLVIGDEDEDGEGIVRALTQLPDTCVLDVVDRGAASAQEIGRVLSLSREYVTRIIQTALSQLGDEHDIDDFDEREHPEDFYVRYSNMGAAELAEIAADLRRKAKR